MAKTDAPVRVDPTTRDARPGSYAVLLEPPSTGSVSIGRLGSLGFDGGVLIYVGSALGPGGLAARCRHHLRIARRAHWHLDYLRPHCKILGFWVAPGETRLEHQWALALGQRPGAGWPLRGFGASDCRCAAHLIHLLERPSTDALRQWLGDGQWLYPPG